MAEELNPIRTYMKALKYAIESDHIDVIKALINYVDINMQYESEYDRATTFLIDAVRKNKKKIVKLLLKNKANVNIQDSTQNTALIYAIINNYEDIVYLLLENGAQILKKNNCNQSALSYAIKNNNINIVELFLDKGTDVVDLKKQEYGIYLIDAIEKDNEEIVKILLDKGIYINYRDIVHSRTALFYAIYKENEKIVKMLLNRNINIDFQDVHNNTALSSAVKLENDKLIKMLLEKGAKASLSTALEYAKKKNKKGIITSCLKANDIVKILKDNYLADDVIAYLVENIPEEEQLKAKNYLREEKEYLLREQEKLAESEQIKQKSSPQTLYESAKEKLSREKLIKEAVIYPEGASLEHTEQIGYGNPNFPCMGWGNKGDDKNSDDN